jgi:hypothetical protein
LWLFPNEPMRRRWSIRVVHCEDLSPPDPF